jgi:RHS repeat-associated protein
VGDLGAIHEDVPFDFGVANALIAACENAAAAVEGQAGSRASWTNTALTDFKGHFSELFRSNAAVAAGDATELCNRLRETARGVRRLKEEARKEQQRRNTAREWVNRNLFEKGWDWLTNHHPPGGPGAEKPTISVSPPINRGRENPTPGSGGRGGGTSSARPVNLRLFANQSWGADNELRSKPGTLKGKFSSFQHRCRWGNLDAYGVFTSFDRWLAANDEDVRWANTIADAFAAAGGNGNISTVSNSALMAALRAGGVDTTRQDLVIDPPQAYGHPPTTGYANDPVNTSTGNFLENETDLSFPGAASSLRLSRCYNSFNPFGGAFGPGWSSLAESGLVFDADQGTARFTLPDGRQIVFPRLGVGWDRAVGENLWLTAATIDEAGSDGFRVSDNDGSWWHCGSDGTLLAYGMGPAEAGNMIRLVRDEAGRLLRLEHVRGRSIDLAWGAVGDDDRIVAAVTSDGRTVDYTYDEAGRLIAAAGPLGTRSYRWDGQGLIAAVIDPDGVVEAENTYDEQRRVVRQRSRFGRLTQFTYLPGRVTVVADEDGTRSNTWIADERGRLVGVVDAEEHRQSTSYDRHGNPVLVTERNGVTTVHEYDSRGRRVRTVTPSGADLTWGYDELDRVTTVVTEQGAVTEFAYEGDGRSPSAITDPEDGITGLQWEHGLLSRVTDPAGVVVRFEYDEFGDLVAVTDAEGNTARMERDAVGRVLAAITPSGHRTSYEYDLTTGLLALRRNPDGATWHYEHTNAGRLTAIIDPTGARTSIEHGLHGEEVRTIDPLGRAVTRHLDDLGNLATVELPDGATWRFAHDALSRLMAMTDPTGGTISQEYDQAGHLIATIDQTGVRRGVHTDQAQGLVRTDDGQASITNQFDSLGRATSFGQADGSAAVLTYDRCGRPVEALDPEGGLTLIRRDAAGRPVEVTSPTEAVTRYEYDRCGRLAAIIDPVRARTTISYDADGHPVRQTLPTGDVAWTRYDVCGRVVAHYQPGVGTFNYIYDSVGRVLEIRDLQYGRRRFRYDPAGQLVAAIDGNGGVTRYTYDSNGRAVEITSPLGGMIRREFDGMNRCVSETDPLGRTTRAGYDEAGRLAWQEDPDGHRTTWTYDSTGRPLSMAVDGRILSSLTRDLRRRTVTIDDHTNDTPSRHQLEWNRRGQLVRRGRDGREVTWTYDADGHRTTMTIPDGSTTGYGWDTAGRLAWLDHPLLGRAAFDRDGSGRITAATASGLIQSWEHRDGWVVAHTRTDNKGASRIAIDRDEDGRITRITRDRGHGPEISEYSYDPACQLIEARIRGAGGQSVTRWNYDAGGRLVAESIDDATIEHVYDIAGQLLATVDADGRRLFYTYDSQGRRTLASDERGRMREFTWSPTGYLAGVTDHAGDQVQRTAVHADALGELAAVDGTEFFWDTAAYAGAPVLAGNISVVAAGPLTGVGSGPDAGWMVPGWRTARSTGTDPWSPRVGVELARGLAGGVAGLGIGASGEVILNGLEWLGARVYDPTSRGFLSADPLDPVPGASWIGNPYSYAGNDPLHALDPSGLRPVTEAELQAYRDNNGIGGLVHDVDHWVSNNWEYIAGGAMVIAGGVLIATGIGGPAGMMLIAAGADTVIQKATTGQVNWGEVAVSGVLGGVGGAGIAAKAGLTGLKATLVAGAASGGISGAGTGAYGYMSGPSPHTVGGFITASAKGAGMGIATGGAGAAAGHGLSALGSKALSSVHPTPEVPPIDAGFGGRTLFHYTDEAGMKGIVDTGQLNPSLRRLNPTDVRYGDGQYLSDISPGTKTSAQLSRAFLGQPFQGQRFTHFVEIDVDGLNVVEGRANVFVVPGQEPLDLTGRVVSFGAN